MRNKNILILGGTKYVGLELINILSKKKVDLFIASRKKIDHNNFIFLDRKSISDLTNLFNKYEFDIIIDFICYSSLDSKKLLDSLKINRRNPKIIFISSIYVYSDPLKTLSNSIFAETNFNAQTYNYSLCDRPQISYIEGKKEMECYANKNYDKDKLVILRFPIILGYGDYTGRTYFYYDKIKNNLRYNPENINNISNYIFSIEASLSIYNFIKGDKTGTYNIASEDISEYDLISIYCNFFKININDFLDSNLEKSRSPFYVNHDFKIDSSKYYSIFPKKIKIENSLLRELSKIN